MQLQELRRCQLRQLEALKYIDRVCRENELTYYVHTGTLLGAARHKGYIPWDMDTDLLMPESDCKRLVEIIDKGNQDDYSVARVEEGWLGADRIVLNRVSCHLPEKSYEEGKIHIGITCLSKAKIYPGYLRNLVNKYAILLVNIIALRHNKVTLDMNKRGYIVKKIALSVFSFLNRNKTDNEIRNMIKRMAVSDSETGYITVFNSFYGFSKETYPSDCFASTMYLPFEDMKVPVPSGYLIVLQTLYGDWKTPPQENNRYPSDLSVMIYEENN